jgi:hypothetical protein
MEDKSQWQERPDGSRHKTPAPWEIAKQEKGVSDHNRLILEMQGLQKPLRGKPQDRGTFYPPVSAKRPTSELIPHTPAINTAVGEYISRGGLTLDIISEQHRLAEHCGKFNLEVLTTDDADSQLLRECGFQLAGTMNRNENNTSVLYRRFRLRIRNGE